MHERVVLEVGKCLYRRPHFRYPYTERFQEGANAWITVREQSSGMSILCVILNICQNTFFKRLHSVNSLIPRSSGDLRGVAGGDGELGCLCGKAGASHLCDGSAHSSGCVVQWLMAAF